MKGTLTISIDLELAWGVWDSLTPEQLRMAETAERPISAALIELFDRHSIQATWAMVAASSMRRARRYAPAAKPAGLRPTSSSISRAPRPAMRSGRTADGMSISTGSARPRRKTISASRETSTAPMVSPSHPWSSRAMKWGTSRNSPAWACAPSVAPMPDPRRRCGASAGHWARRPILPKRHCPCRRRSWRRSAPTG